MKIVEAYKITDHNGSKIKLINDYGYDEYINVEEGYTLIGTDGATTTFYEDYFDAERSLCEIEGGVSIGPDYVTIFDQGEEIAHWIEDEWMQEPELATTIANAIRMYYVKGPAYMRQLLNKEVS